MKSTFFFLQTVACACNRCRVKTDGHAVQIFREYSLVITHALNTLSVLLCRVFLKWKLLHECLVFCGNKIEENCNKPSPYKK